MNLSSLTYFLACLSSWLRHASAVAVSASVVHLLDKQFENEVYYYDLSYVNSQFTNLESAQNKFANRERSGSHSSKNSCNQIKPITSNLRTDLKLSYFYQKYSEAYGIPVIGSNRVAHNSLRRACYVLRFFLAARPEFKAAYYKRLVRVVVLGAGETVLSVPEYSNLPSAWSQALRGLSPTLQIPLVTVSEENVQCGNDKFKNEDLLVHQLSYGLVTLSVLSDEMQSKLNAAYAKAKATSPASSFLLSDRKEYLASGIDIYLNASSKREASGGLSLDTLKRDHRDLFALIEKIFACDNTYINKCKATREAELAQVLHECNPDNTIVTAAYNRPTRPTTTTTTSSSTTTTSTKAITTTTSATTTRRSIFENKDFASDSFFNKVIKATSSLRPITTAAATQKSSPSSSLPPQVSKKEDCENFNVNCDLWASKGQCTRNRQYMHTECRKSCQVCGEGAELSGRASTLRRRVDTTTQQVDLDYFKKTCRDENNFCVVKAQKGECKTNPHFMLIKCKRSCNLCGDLVDRRDRIQPVSARQQQLTTSRRPEWRTHEQQQVSTATSTSTTEPASMLNKNSDYYKYLFDSDRPLQRENGESEEEEGEEENDDDYHYINRPTTIATTSVKSTSTRKVTSEKKVSTADCSDKVNYCKDLAERGDCESNTSTMEYYCKRTCKLC